MPDGNISHDSYPDRCFHLPFCVQFVIGLVLNISPSINYARNGQVIPGMALHLGF
jgi:hypothetical protein